MKEGGKGGGAKGRAEVHSEDSEGIGLHVENNQIRLNNKPSG